MIFFFKKSKSYTLIELMVSMAVFAVLMLALMNFFSQTQKLWTGTAHKTEMFENARIALNLMARDIQSCYYDFDMDPNGQRFFSCYTDTGVGNDWLGLVASQPQRVDANSLSRLYEIQYRVDNNWLEINRVSDADTMIYDWNADYTGTLHASNVSTDAFSTSDSTWEQVIPYVIDLRLTCLKRDGTVWTTPAPSTAPTADIRIPYAVMIELILLDRASFAKWQETANNNFCDSKKRLFSKTVIIERGQYD